MNRRKFSIFMCLALAVAVLSWGIDQGWGQSPQNNDPNIKYKGTKATQAEKKAAAARFKALYDARDKDSVSALAFTLDSGGIPHYFGPFGNWAYSPLPRGPITAVTLVDGGTGYNNPLVSIVDVYGTGSGAAAASATVGAGGDITGITGGLGGTNYSAPTVTIVDNPALCGTGMQPACGEDATATATIATVPIGGALTGGIHKFVDKVPGLTPAGANTILQPSGDPGQYIPVAVADTATFLAPASDYYEIALVEYSEKMHTDLPATRLRGYVQLETPAVLAAMAAHVPPLVSKRVNVGGGHFAIDNPHFLGPVIVAGRDKPVRLKFYNLLPIGPVNPATGRRPGDLFLPVDETVMGAGDGPVMGETYTQNRATIHLHGNNTAWISDGTTHQWTSPAGETTSYPKGVSVYNVPDMPNPGKPPVPPTVDPAAGTMTFYYTNAQSARLMFYHDHAMGITRLNVYAGEAAGYVITDQVDQDMINGTNVSGVNNLTATNTPLDPGQTNAKVLPGIGIPLVILDRTFVDATTIAAQDPTWNWGTGPRSTTPPNAITAAVTGDLWYPHVYMSAQNPWDESGTNAFGRWHYGPWFIQPTPECVNGLPVGCIEVGPVPNEYCTPLKPSTCVDANGITKELVEGVDYNCSAAPWEPPCRPGIPNPSMPGEAFMDTPVVNGTVYPYLEVEPKAYRFRILNAGDDRFLNLQLYVAADKRTPTTAGSYVFNPVLPPTNLCSTAPSGGGVPYEHCTEVDMVPVSVAPANQFGDTPSGIPDPTTKGPDWIQIGTEGGFMPKPVVVPQQPIGFNLNATTFNFGNVNQHSLLLGTAERADVVVDFSLYAGKTLILYNDSPAAFPAGVSTYDYFTGVADQMDIGGAPTTQPGYGPNTRTIMQIRVNLPLGTPTPDVTLAKLNAVFAKGATKRGVFEVSQDPIIIPQKAYQSAYNVTNFPSASASQYLQIADAQKTFQPINAAGVLQPAVTIPLEFKAMHDEMGGVYDTQFGRMSGMLGLASQTSPIHTLIPYGYASPPVDIIKGSVSGSQIGVLPDGTQIWRIFHNGVDTHTIHTHLFTSQLINRNGQDGINLPPDPTELGWKDTFRINPLEVTYIAMRPIIPTPAQLPFQVPNSVRLIDPTMPEGVPLIPPPPAGWFDPQGNNIPEILNHYVNFGWEYVWHCHILAHEEMDMMHSLVAAVPPLAPTGLTASVLFNPRRVLLSWTNNALNATNFKIQRATDAAFTANVTTFTIGAVPTTYTDTPVTLVTPNTFYYRVLASNIVGDTVTPGFPIVAADSTWSNTRQVTIENGHVGLYNPSTQTFYLKYTNSAGPADLTFTFGASGDRPVYGDWNADGSVTIGVFHPSTQQFLLRNTNDTGPANTTFTFSGAASTYLSIAGDWTGSGTTTVGLYNRVAGTFSLKNTNVTGPANTTFRFGPTNATGWLPIAGDWDGNGTMTVGLYNPATGTFYLKNANTAGAADLTFRFGPANATGWLPVAGDWDGNGSTTIGLYNPATGTFYLKNANTAGAADLTFRFGPTNATGWLPFAGM